MLEARTLLTLTFSPLTAAPLRTGSPKGESFHPLCIATTGGPGRPILITVDASSAAGGYGHAEFHEWYYSTRDQDFQRPTVDHGSAGGGFGNQWAGFDIATGNFGGGLNLAVTVFDYSPYGGGSFVSIGSWDALVVPTLYSVGGVYMKAGDFTGNGKLDLLVTGGITGLLLGNGDGTFQSYQSIDSSYSGRAVVGDFDGRHYPNGLPILDFATIGGMGVNVFMNNGDGTFRTPVNYAVGLSSQILHDSIAVGDFRGDGKLDLAVASYDHNNVSVLLGNGDGTFQPAVTYAVGDGPTSISVGHFNGDGKLDIVVANDASQGIYHDSSVSVLLGTGTGTFLRAQNFAEIFPGGSIAPTGGTDYYALAVGDFAGTGYDGVAVVDTTDGQIIVMQGAGQSFFQPAVQLPVGGGVVAAGDFNGDGKTDLAFGGGQVYLGDGDGTFQSPINGYAGFPDTTSMAVADFNGDGKLDLVEVGFEGLHVLLGNGDGTFHPSGFVIPANAQSYQIKSIAVGDFNGDGKPDLAVEFGGYDFAPYLAIFLGHGDGTFGILQAGVYQPNARYNLSQDPDYPSTLAVGDFNGDGKLDLVVGGVGVLLGNGDGTFQSPVSYGSGGQFVAVADFDGRRYPNGQPILDLVTAVGNGVNVSLGNGDGTFQSPVFYPLSVPIINGYVTVFRTSPLVVGDFNGDGKLDIAVGTIGGVRLLLGNGDGTFQRQFGDNALNSFSLAAADVTGGGRSELVTAGGAILFAAPPQFSLSSASVAEHQPAGTVVGTFNTPNDDPNESFTYQFVSGTGGADNAAFTIDPQGHLHTAAGFDFATRSSYSIRVRSTDVVGQISEGVFTIQVLPLQETVLPPTLPGGTVGVPYRQTITAEQAFYAGAFTFSVTGGSLPPGLSLSTGGVLSGAPTAVGSFAFTVTARESGGATASQAYTVAVAAYVATPAQLVAAINAANQTGIPATITLAPGATFNFTLEDNATDGWNALPVITGTVTIIGNNDTIERTGPNPSRLFDVASGGSLTLQNVTLTGGWARGAGASADGGAIYSAGTLRLSGVTVQGNRAQGADGVGFQPDRLTGRNGASAYGGGIFVAGGSVTLLNDTLSGNNATGGNGGNGVDYTVQLSISTAMWRPATPAIG
jgi:hypothetical protein